MTNRNIQSRLGRLEKKLMRFDGDYVCLWDEWCRLHWKPREGFHPCKWSDYHVMNTLQDRYHFSIAYRKLVNSGGRDLDMILEKLEPKNAEIVVEVYSKISEKLALNGEFMSYEMTKIYAGCLKDIAVSLTEKGRIHGLDYELQNQLGSADESLSYEKLSRAVCRPNALDMEANRRDRFGVFKIFRAAGDLGDIRNMEFLRDLKLEETNSDFNQDKHQETSSIERLNERLKRRLKTLRLEGDIQARDSLGLYPDLFRIVPMGTRISRMSTEEFVECLDCMDLSREKPIVRPGEVTFLPNMSEYKVHKTLKQHIELHKRPIHGKSD